MLITPVIGSVISAQIMSAYRVAIDQTAQTIDRRAKCYRNLIAVVTIVSLCSIGGALAAWTLEPLIGLLLIFPVCGLYFFVDGEILHGWRSQLIASWTIGELDFWAFRDAMRAASYLPKATLQSMVEILPSSPNWAMERAASERTRRALALVVAAIHRRCANTALVRVAASVMVVASVIFAVTLGVWYPMLFVAAIVPLPLLVVWMKWRQLRKLRTLIVTACRDPEFNGEIFSGLLNHLDWSGMSLSDREELTTAVFSPVSVSATGNNREQATL